MTVRFCLLGIAFLLAGCGGDAGMRCEYSAGNLDAIKAQVASLKAGGTTEAEVIKSLGNPTNSTPTPEGGKTDEYEFPQKLSSGSSAAYPVKNQKVSFVFDARNVLQSMQISL